MIKKVTFLIFAVYLSSIIHSCCTEEYEYKWKGFEIQIIDNSGKEPVICDLNQIINKNALGFRILMNDTVFYTAQRFSVITECRATSCGQQYTRLHSMTSIAVKTIYDYSEKFPAESDITSLFKARISEKINEDYDTIDNMISSINATTNDWNQQKTADFDLYLLDNTCAGGKQKFEINILLSDGNMLAKQTDNLLME
jgi:hypothetical protein